MSGFDGHGGDLVQGTFTDKHVTGTFAQPGAVTAGAGTGAHVFQQFFTHYIGFSFAVAAFHIREHTFKSVFAFNQLATTVSVTKVDDVFATAVEHTLLEVFGQLVKGQV